MNRFIKVVAVLILLPLSVVIPTLSLESYYAPQINAQSSNDSDLAKRTKQYRAAITDDLSVTVQQRIKLRCLAVQTNMKAFDARVETMKTNRAAAYDNILGQLNTLVENLQNQAFDTTKLEANVTDLNKKVDKYKAEMKSYSQAIDDLTVIDCTKDPVAFKGALEAAREDHQKLIASVSDVRTFVTNTIKPQLQTIREQLDAGQVTGGDTPVESEQ